MIKSPENMNSRALFYCLNSVHDTTEFQTISKATPSAVHLSDSCLRQRGGISRQVEAFAVILR
ncbi:hypothetical protein CUR65_05575 [Salmonella enterica subsp. enterica serovar Legon]|nr:hypothetical protein CUR58_00390 [Salmonella enterica subsp. enterica serovar Legon]PVB86304.1 hypothetical protein CUR66_18925 [Salmonella enterica subsp. enterica serovar Legon]PVB91086.1 hypothetical protein CUR65_05575 [Salmonella enterica subsp. enterica serovar Legon]PVB95453.1 hypothetical protein CUR73_20495 [Salmonella enterica subsp. enterica serovar Legon]PVC00843.1 hypothetical protein CUR74_21035 [Salmonella enterica subsp. enterica serovar Legon]